jgi:hypothetical protein
MRAAFIYGGVALAALVVGWVGGSAAGKKTAPAVTAVGAVTYDQFMARG